MPRNPHEIAPGVLMLRTLIANLYIVRTAPGWVLVDAGLGGHAAEIRSAARAFVGTDAPPAAIVLTHGHFDHVGSLEALLESWTVPVFAHVLERPYLSGLSAYPPPDPLVGGGLMALASRLYPRGPINVSASLEFLPDGGDVPAMPGWRWIRTPGHTAGHVSLFRERDRLLLAGDAVTTTRQESAIAVALQRRELHGPPAYFTQNWREATESVRRIAALGVEVLATGHGEPWRGPEVAAGLRELSDRFRQREVPRFGRYADRPAVTDARGIVSLPPDPLPRVAAGAAMMAGVAWGLSHYRRRRAA